MYFHNIYYSLDKENIIRLIKNTNLLYKNIVKNDYFSRIIYFIIGIICQTKKII